MVARKMPSNVLDNATIGNLLLKINAKLNGTNHSFTENCSVAKLCKGVMLLGADVTHPSPDQMNIPSVAAVSFLFTELV
ncbi:protein argonaute-2-like [Homalodisca vitripennis]|uniref:protein argonaute-2-like n=1 Tax=Homalodisca vitripennis TaxID=197043 RepID=UPI001EEB5383|nr:protein argonaute-2-like [Homalodisca vitripennis]